MTDTFDPQTMDDLLDLGMESPADDAEADGSLPDADDLDAGQSGDDEEQLATDSEEDQSAESNDPESEGAVASPDATEPVSPVAAWDSDENPYRQDALALAELRQAAARAQAERLEQERIQKWGQAFEKLAELDEDDARDLTGELINEIRQTAVEPHLERIDVLEHGLTAVVAAIEEVVAEIAPKAKMDPATLLGLVKNRAAEVRELGRTAPELDAALKVAKQTQSRMTAQLQATLNENKRLKAELAKKAISKSGALRTETTSVGANDNGEASWDTILAGRI